MALRIERCPETGICSFIRPDGGKMDLMPTEVEDVRDAAGDAQRVRKIIAESDAAFAAALSEDEVGQIVKRLS